MPSQIENAQAVGLFKANVTDAPCVNTKSRFAEKNGIWRRPSEKPAPYTESH